MIFCSDFDGKFSDTLVVIYYWFFSLYLFKILYFIFQSTYKVRKYSLLQYAQKTTIASSIIYVKNSVTLYVKYIFGYSYHRYSITSNDMPNMFSNSSICDEIFIKSLKYFLVLCHSFEGKLSDIYICIYVYISLKY